MRERERERGLKMMVSNRGLNVIIATLHARIFRQEYYIIIIIIIISFIIIIINSQ